MFGKTISMKNGVMAFLALFAMFLLVVGCQKDDICSETTLTTPLLKISFYDNDSPNDSIPKLPTNLTIIAEGAERNYRTRINTSEVSIPLRTDVDITTYQFILNAAASADDSTSVENKDVITFTYARNQVYINRACSFKMSYVNLQATLENETPIAENWIEDVIVLNSTIEDETTTHISIYF